MASPPVIRLSQSREDLRAVTLDMARLATISIRGGLFSASMTTSPHWKRIGSDIPTSSTDGAEEDYDCGEDADCDIEPSPLRVDSIDTASVEPRFYMDQAGMIEYDADDSAFDVDDTGASADLAISTPSPSHSGHRGPVNAADSWRVAATRVQDRLPSRTDYVRSDWMMDSIDLDEEEDGDGAEDGLEDQHHTTHHTTHHSKGAPGASVRSTIPRLWRAAMDSGNGGSYHGADQDARSCNGNHDDDAARSYARLKQECATRGAAAYAEATGDVIPARANESLVPLCIVYTGPAQALSFTESRSDAGACMATATALGAFNDIGHVGLIVNHRYINVSSVSRYVTIEGVYERIAYWTASAEEAHRMGETKPRHRFFGRYITARQEKEIVDLVGGMANSDKYVYTRATTTILGLLGRIGLPERLIIHWAEKANLHNFTCVTCVAGLLLAGSLVEEGRFRTVAAMTPERFVEALSDNDGFDEVEYEEWSVQDLSSAVREWDKVQRRASILG